jgi:hypothetical protein
MGRDGVVRGGGVSAAFGEDHAGACGVHAPEAEADEFLVFGACFGEIALAFGVEDGAGEPGHGADEEGGAENEGGPDEPAV